MFRRNNYLHIINGIHVHVESWLHVLMKLQQEYYISFNQIA